MSDVIRLLPDSVANQIAAGEVIQRPSSAAKELLENAIDAGADSIQLIIKDAGKTLIQVTDNGTGMSDTDARLCFERHATSKIQQASDLFSIRTMGFRGEALASMAAIARVEIKTKTADQEIGSGVVVEGAKLLTQEPCQCKKGTSVSVKNLFYNTPARRNFLKSDNVERRHIMQEFYRVAIARPDIAFDLYCNGQLTHQLGKGKLIQRIANLLGNKYKQQLVPVEENTQIVNIKGYIGKPEFAKKTRGEQYLFVNQRYIRSPYLNHAIENGFDSLIPEDTYVSFFLFLETDPETIDVNVHPTKTEIKFQDEKYIYQIIKTAVKHALGSYTRTPGFIFDREQAFDDPSPAGDKPVKPPSVMVNPDFNPFNTGYGGQASQQRDLRNKTNPKQWEQLFPSDQDISRFHEEKGNRQYLISTDWDEKNKEDNGQKKFFQLHNRYILIPVKSGLMVIDQQRAHERVLYDKFKRNRENNNSASQQLLFPENITLTENKADILKEILDDIKTLGFGIHMMGKTTFVIDAVPAVMAEEHGLQDIIEGIVDNVQINQAELKQDLQTNVLRSMAKRLAIRHGKALSEEEMAAIAHKLFACDLPQYTPSGKPVLQIITNEELYDRFK